MGDFLAPVVIDNGTGRLKAGFAGEDEPQLIFDTIVGSPKHRKVMAGAVEGDNFVGSQANELRGLLKLRYPMENGIVTDWIDMERVWAHAFSELKAQSKEHPLLLTEAPLNPRRNREKAAEILFETFNVPALFISVQAILSLYASGRTTGMVLDCGDGTCSATPVYEGFALPHAIERIDIGGRDVTRQLQRLLRRSGHPFRTTAEFECVRRVKESLCYVALDVSKAESGLSDIADNDNGVQSYRLPDGRELTLTSERFRAPEILFRPSLIGSEQCGVADALALSVRRSDLDLRKTLWQNVLLSGGSTCFAGFGERLLNDARMLAGDVKIKISAPKERLLSTWMGGSILASLGTFKSMWALRTEYENEGVSVINRFF
mmetsp:Transcript_15696/g.26968  ORF Transcript_15696/g.26968 Transcript_15696/m.26968 type:complete len:376 (+) Transcript_15696:54-1181(+)